MDFLDGRGKDSLRSEVNQNEDDFEGEILREKFMQLHHVQQLQKSILKESMHNAMSPLSAISGYLELIDMSLNMESDISQIQYYRKKIETGVQEVNELLQQLQEVYKEHEEIVDDSEEVVVDINWLIREVYKDMKIKQSQCMLKLSRKSIHISADLYSIKLIIFKLINFALKSSPAANKVKVVVEESSEAARVAVLFKASELKKKEIKQILKVEGNLNPQHELYQNSLNEGLSVSLQLIKYMKGSILYKEGNEQLGTFIMTIPKA